LNGQLVWVSLNGEAPVEAEADPCPWFALATPPEIPAAHVAGPVLSHGIELAWRPQAARTPAAPYRQQNPRAPPSL
ncbi:MAG: hypothetical protein AAF908_07615, partial [Pseudomonadota bacterium]